MKILPPKCEHVDVDKAVKDMNQEERTVLIVSKMNLIIVLMIIWKTIFLC